MLVVTYLPERSITITHFLKNTPVFAKHSLYLYGLYYTERQSTFLLSLVYFSWRMTSQLRLRPGKNRRQVSGFQPSISGFRPSGAQPNYTLISICSVITIACSQKLYCLQLLPAHLNNVREFRIELNF